MKIRTPKDVELLDQRIQERLGVDVKKYRNEEALSVEKKGSQIIEHYIDAIEVISGSVDKLLNVTFRMAQIPLLIITILSSIVLILFIYLIW